MKSTVQQCLLCRSRYGTSSTWTTSVCSWSPTLATSSVPPNSTFAFKLYDRHISVKDDRRSVNLQQLIPQAWFYRGNIFWCKMADKKLRADCVHHKVSVRCQPKSNELWFHWLWSAFASSPGSRSTQLPSFFINLGMKVFTTSADSLELVLDPLDLRYFGIKWRWNSLFLQWNISPPIKIKAHLSRISSDH